MANLKMRVVILQHRTLYSTTGEVIESSEAPYLAARKWFATDELKVVFYYHQVERLTGLSLGDPKLLRDPLRDYGREHVAPLQTLLQYADLRAIHRYLSNPQRQPVPLPYNPRSIIAHVRLLNHCNELLNCGVRYSDTSNPLYQDLVAHGLLKE